MYCYKWSWLTVVEQSINDLCCMCQDVGPGERGELHPAPGQPQRLRPQRAHHLPRVLQHQGWDIVTGSMSRIMHGCKFSGTCLKFRVFFVTNNIMFTVLLLNCIVNLSEITRVFQVFQNFQLAPIIMWLCLVMLTARVKHYHVKNINQKSVHSLPTGYICSLLYCLSTNWC